MVHKSDGRPAVAAKGSSESFHIGSMAYPNWNGNGGRTEATPQSSSMCFGLSACMRKILQTLR